jgi:hypothetical protein
MPRALEPGRLELATAPYDPATEPLVHGAAILLDLLKIAIDSLNLSPELRGRYDVEQTNFRALREREG